MREITDFDDSELDDLSDGDDDRRAATDERGEEAPSSKATGRRAKIEGLGNAFWGVLVFLYSVGSVLIGVGAALLAWWYAINKYGIFLGVGLGWLPSIFIGVVAGIGWPLAVLVWEKYPDVINNLSL